MNSLSRGVVTYLVAALFGLLAAFHVVLPASIDQPGVVAAVLAGVAVVTLFVRLARGEKWEDDKAWWASKTIWAQIVAFVAALLSLAGLAPLDQASVVGGIMAVVGVINAALHPLPKQPISGSGAAS